MEKTKGQCLCGAVTYEVVIPERAFYAGLCHCRDCQRYTGTAFASSLMVPRDGIEISGDLKFYGKETEKGTIMERGFCPECGSNVICRSDAWADQYILSAGTLDDPSLYQPRMNIFTRTAMKHVWDMDSLRKVEDGV